MFAGMRSGFVVLYKVILFERCKFSGDCCACRGLMPFRMIATHVRILDDDAAALS